MPKPSNTNSPIDFFYADVSIIVNESNLIGDYWTEGQRNKDLFAGLV